MNGRFLLDTNIVIASYEGDGVARDLLGHVEQVFLPCVVLGELYFGAFRSGRREANLSRLRALIHTHRILDCDRDTAREYGLIRRELERKGRPIPDNDLWIAAIARQYDLTLVTRDAHFDEIEGIHVESW